MQSKTLMYAFLAGFMLSGCASMTGSKQAAAPTLYERLGGVYNIAAVVDDFVDRLSVNDELNANPAIRAARDRVHPAGLKFQVTAQFCEETGGPQQYYGRSMKDSHQHLNITDRQWQVMLENFKITLDKFKVPEKEQHELFAIVENTRADIVSGK